MLVLKGIAASPGVAIGPAVLLPGDNFAVSRQYIEPAEVKTELQKMLHAMQKHWTSWTRAKRKFSPP